MTATETRTWYQLQTLADQADARYAATIKARTGRDRWTMRSAQERIPEIRIARDAKVAADEALLAYMRYLNGNAHRIDLSEQE